MRRRRTVRILSVLAVNLVLIGVVEADISTGLVGHWPLDGDGTDVSGNDLHGTINGNVVSAPDRMGYPDSAMSFPGEASSHVKVGDPEELQITGEMTLAAWVFLNIANQNNGRIIAKSGGGGQRSWSLNVEFNSGGVTHPATFQVALNGSTNMSVLDTQPLPTDEWAHMAGVYRPGEQTEIYVNGELRNTNTTNIPAGQHSDNGLPVLIGARNACSNCGWNGFIDEARVYARALSADDITELVAFHPAPRVKAWGPEPADGASDVLIPLLKWNPGVTGVLHDVYFGTDPNLGPEDLAQSRAPLTIHYYASGITPGTTYYWRIDEIEADMTTVHTGDVWSFTAMPYTAYLPTPADGETDVSPDPNLSLAWHAGREAIEHHLYFGDSFDDVNTAGADADKGTMKEATFVLADALEPLTTYHWRVDETAAGGTVRAGQIWAFATFLAVEDFEAYTDEEGSRIYETWIDGWTNDTGSTVGNIEAPFAEQTIVHDGSQSMPLDYNNVNPPYYSEAERSWSTVQNWTENDAGALVLSVRGRTGNGDDTLYVAVEDSSGNTGIAICPEAGVFKATQWIEWDIPLDEFSSAGVNLSTVKKMYVGVGDRNAPVKGGAGRIYIDSIRITKLLP